MRDNPLFWTITTAGSDTAGVCYDERELTRGVLEGLYTMESRFGMIFTVDRNDKDEGDEDDPFDPKVWKKANPVLHSDGLLVQDRMVRTMHRFAESAKLNEKLRAEFMRKRLNIWIDEDIKYFNAREFAAEPNMTTKWPDADFFANKPCAIGMDLAAKKDLTALAIMWLDGEEDVIWGQWHFWLPHEAFKGYAMDKKQPWEMWRDKKYLNVTPGRTIDYAVVYKKIKELAKVYNVSDIAFDSWNANQVTHDLTDDGYNTIEFRQSTANYNSAMKSWVKRISDGTLKHPRNELLNWNVHNVIARTDINMNEAPNRKDSTGKIDGVCAGLMATAVLENEDNGPADIGDVLIL